MTIQEIEKFPAANWYYDMRDELRRHIYARAEEAFRRGDAARDAIRTRVALRRRQRGVRRFFLQCIGGLPPSHTPLNARSVGVVQGDGFKLEKVIFESRPRVFITAHLYLPDDLRGPRGAVLYLSGHSPEAKHCDENQVICQTLARAGLVVFAQDPVGQGERFSYYDPERKTTTVRCGTGEHDYAGVQCQPLGDSIARYFVHDSIRSVDYLRTRSEVDPAKIGVTGASGGGTQTCMMMFADPRIAAAAPAAFVMNRESYMWTGQAQDAEQIWPGFTAAGLDHEDVLIAMCPRPVRVLANTMDIFPIEGTRRTVERCKRFYQLCGEPSNLDIVEREALHSFAGSHLQAAAGFFSRHLLGRKPVRSEWPPSAFPQSKVWCTSSGQARGELRGARFVYEENLQRLREVAAQRKKVSGKQAMAWLRRRVFAQRTPCPPNPRFYWSDSVEDLAVEGCFWWSQASLHNHAMLFREHARQGQRLPVTLAVWDGGCTTLQDHVAWIRSQCRAGRAVLVLEVSGVGSIAPHPINPYPPREFYGVIHKLADDLIWLDDDLAALRTYDVIRALDMMEQWPLLEKRGVRGYARGKHGVYLRLASRLDHRLKHIEVVDGIGSFTGLVRSRHYDSFDIKSVIIRGALRHLDLPA